TLTSPPTTSPLFPYTTLFRSRNAGADCGLLHPTGQAGGQGALLVFLGACRPADYRCGTHLACHQGRWPSDGRSSPGACKGRCQRSEEHTSELQSRENLVCRLL